MVEHQVRAIWRTETARRTAGPGSVNASFKVKENPLDLMAKEASGFSFLGGANLFGS
jgi:hypothetical protein